MEAAASLAKGIAPTLSNTIFALSVDKDWLGGRFYWIVMIGISLSLSLSTLLIRDVHAAWRSSPRAASTDVLEDPAIADPVVNAATRVKADE
jgi:glucose-6-phosphate isomerase